MDWTVVVFQRGDAVKSEEARMVWSQVWRVNKDRTLTAGDYPEGRV